MFVQPYNILYNVRKNINGTTVCHTYSEQTYTTYNNMILYTDLDYIQQYDFIHRFRLNTA